MVGLVKYFFTFRQPFQPLKEKYDATHTCFGFIFMDCMSEIVYGF